MSDPLPVMVLGRLVADTGLQRHGIDRGLPRDAILRSVQGSEIAGLRAILVHAISATAKRFYGDRHTC
jgi:hypothetical protein